MAKAGTCRLCGQGFAPYGGRYHGYCKECTAKADRAAAKPFSVDCKECGKKFFARTNTTRYCSDECRAVVGRRRVRESMRRYLADPERRAVVLARTRASAAARRARERKGRQKQGHGRRRPAGRGTARPPSAAPGGKSLACRLCGSAFAPYGGTGNRAYCKKCTAKADREVGRVWRIQCAQCGREFSATHRLARYCSDACRTDGRRRSDRVRSRRRLADKKKRAVASAHVRASAARIAHV